MSERIVRQNLSGGELGKRLWTRSDLEHYHKANTLQKNFISTPYGGIERRRPLVHVSPLRSIVVDGVVYYPSDARGFAFVYDASTKYDVVLVSYAAAGEDDLSRFVVFDHVSGAQLASVDCGYVQAEFFELDFHQVNDVLFITHQNHPPARLERHADNEWKLIDCVIISGPFLAINTDRSLEVSLYGEPHDMAADYVVGDVVQLGSGNPVAITAASYEFWYEHAPLRYYLLRLVIGSAHGFSVDDNIYVDGLDSADHVFDGQYSVVRTGENYIEINTGRTYNYGTIRLTERWACNYALPADFTDAALQGGSGIGFYTCSQDHSGQLPAPGSVYWRRTYSRFQAVVQCNQPVFSQIDVGRKIRMEGTWSELASGKFTQGGGGNQTSDWLPAYGTVSVETNGVWGGELRLAYSIDDGQKWEIIARFDGLAGDKNYSFSRDIFNVGALVRLECDGWVAFGGNTDLIYTISIKDGSPVSMDITGYVDERTVNVALEGAVKYAFSSWKFALGAFGGNQGYPAAVCVHEERLLFGGTRGRPFSIFGSAVNDWENFADGTLETSPIVFRAQSDNVTRISWMLSRDKLYFGTDFGEYTAGASNSDAVLSGENPPSVKRHTAHGSAPIKAVAVHDRVIYVMSDKKTVRSMEEKDYTSSLTSKDLTIFAPDIAGTGLRTICVQRTPYTVLWGVCEAGNMVSFTVDPENDIMGWAQHETAGGLIKSAWAVPDALSRDEITCIVEREDVVVDAYGDCTPDVSGIFDGGSGFYIYGSAYPELNKFQGVSGTLNERSVYGNGTIIWANGEWNILGDLFEVLYRADSYDPKPPEGGWYAVNGIDPAPIVYEAPYSLDKADVFSVDLCIRISGAGFEILGKDAGSPELFECSTLFGTYTPVAGSGATGSIEVQPLNYHLEKMSSSETEYADSLGGPVERVMESLMEPTSLIQGQGVLESNKVRVTKVLLYLVDSQGGAVSVNGGASWTSIKYDDASNYTGMKELRVDGGNVENLHIQIRTRSADPFELTGIALDVAQQTNESRRR